MKRSVIALAAALLALFVAPAAQADEYEPWEEQLLIMSMMGIVPMSGGDPMQLMHGVASMAVGAGMEFSAVMPLFNTTIGLMFSMSDETQDAIHSAFADAQPVDGGRFGTYAMIPLELWLDFKALAGSTDYSYLSSATHVMVGVMSGFDELVGLSRDDIIIVVREEGAGPERPDTDFTEIAEILNMLLPMVTMGLGLVGGAVIGLAFITQWRPGT
jgi:hypothetical protein